MQHGPTKSPVLSIRLRQDRETTVTSVEYVDLLHDAIRHRISSSKEDCSLFSVFSRRFAELLQSLVAQITNPHMVLSLPDLRYVSNGLHLGGAQIVSTQDEEGAQKMRIRFSPVEGEVQDILRDAYTATRTEPDAIAVEALERVVTRAYGATQLRRSVQGFAEPQAAFYGYSRNILDKRDDLLFRLHLLQLAIEKRQREAARQNVAQLGALPA